MCAKKAISQTFEERWIPQESGQQIQEFKFHS
jgi:hypothetical protein